MYGYMPKSKVKETIRDIMSDYSHEGFDLINYGCSLAVADYLEQTDLVTAYELRTSDWPNMEGGEAFVAWVEDGYLWSEQWTYSYL